MKLNKRLALIRIIWSICGLLVIFTISFLTKDIETLKISGFIVLLGVLAINIVILFVEKEMSDHEKVKRVLDINFIAFLPRNISYGFKKMIKWIKGKCKPGDKQDD